VDITKEITHLEKSNVKLSLTVPRDEVRSRYQELLKDYIKDVQMPGFRRGKVPAGVLERKFGDVLKSEALGRIINAALADVFDNENIPVEEKPLPYSSPEVQGTPALDLEADLTFAVVYDVLPQVHVGQWKGLEVEIPAAEVTDEDLDRELKDIRERNAIVQDRDDDAAARKDDVVTVDCCEIGENGEVLPDTKREDFVFTLGTGRAAYKFDDEITGMKKGETREFEKTFPEDFDDSSLAGQTKKLRVTLTALKEKNLPELDDDLAQDVDEKFNTLEDLKNNIRERLQKDLEHRLRTLKINALLEKVMENTPVILPESMVQAEISGRLRNMARRFNTSPEMILKMFSDNGAANAVEEEWRPEAEKALHSRLIVETIIQEQKFEVSDDDLEKEFESISAETGISPEEVKKKYQSEEEQEFLREDIKERKFLDLLLAENTIKSGEKKTYLDLMANIR
jgi:trigger factor